MSDHESSIKLIKTKSGLLNLAEELGNVSHACKVIGYSRDSLYKIKDLYDILMDRYVSAMNYANRICLFLQVEFVVYGCGMGWKSSANA